MRFYCFRFFSKAFVFFLVGLLGIATATAQNCTVNAGTPTTYCNVTTFELTGKQAGQINASPDRQWTQVGGSPMLTISNPGNLTTNVTGVVPGVFVFRLSAKCEDGVVNFNDVTITVLATPTQAQAGPDQIICNTPVTLAANAPGAGETGKWKIVTDNTGSFSNASNPNSTFTPAGLGTYVLQWSVNNGYCQTIDEVAIKVLGGDQPVSAGPDQTLSCSGNRTSLEGSNPGLDPQTGLWSLVSGPNAPIIADPSSPASTITGLVPGTYVLRWSVNGPCFSGSDLVTITVIDTKVAPVVGGNKTLTFCRNDNVSQVLLNAAPLGSGENGGWVQSQGPAATIVSPNSPTTQITGLDGTSQYKFVWTATNPGGCSSSATHTVYFVPDLQGLSNPPDQTLACQQTNSLVNITYNYGGVTSASGLTRNIKLITSPLANPGRIKPQRSGSVGNDTWTIEGLDTAGLYVFQFEYRNACGAAFRNVSIVVSDTSATPNAGSDVLLPCNEFATQLVAADVPPNQGVGQWSQVGGPAATIVNPNATLTDLTLSSEGLYTFRWNIQNGPSCNSKQDEIVVTKSSLQVVPANAGNDSTICAGLFTLKANAPALTQKGVWSGVPSGVTISDIYNPQATLSGLVSGQVLTLTWTISNACGQSSDDVVLTVNNDFSISANGGPNQCLPSGTSQVQLNGNDAGVGVPFWTSLDGAKLSSTVDQNPTASILSDGTYRFVYNILNPGCNINTDTVLVTVSAPTTIAAAGTNQDLCETSLPIATFLVGNAPSIGTGIWKQVGGNAGPNIVLPGLATTAVNNLGIGVYDFEWRITNGACSTTMDTVRIITALAPEPVDAGPNQSVCDVASNTQIQLAASTVTNGNGVWTVLSGPGGNAPIFSDVNDPQATVRNLQNGTYVLQWNTVSNPGCPVFTDQVSLFITAKADAGPNTSNSCDVTTITLTGNINTDGTWTLLGTPTPPNMPSITNDNPTPNAAIVTGMITGTYKFEYSLPAIGSCPATSDEITVNIQQSPTVANAGSNVELCAGITTTTLTGNTPTIGTPLWTRISGPNTPAESGNSTPTLLLSSLVPGSYEYEYAISNGSCPVSKSNVFVIVANAADAGSDQAFCASGLTGNATILSGNVPVFYTGTWTQQSGPVVANILNPASNSTGVNGMTPGTYVFRWTINTPGSCGNNFDEVLVEVDPTLDITNLAGPDKEKCEGEPNFSIGSSSGPIGATYSWLPSTLLSDASALQPTFTGIGAGTYNYTLTATRGSCTATDAVKIVINQVPVQPVLSGPTNLCENATTTVSVVSVQDGVTYNWSDGLGSGTSKTVGPGSYTVTPVFDLGGCSGNSATITIISDALPTVAAAGTNADLCQDVSTVTLTGNTPATGTPFWSFISGPNTPIIDAPGAANPSITLQGLLAGSYVYRYSISNGTCPSSTDDVTIRKERTANAGPNQRLCNASSATLAANSPVVYNGIWTQVSKPSGAPDVTFADDTNPNTTVSGLTFGAALSGTYVLQWSILSGGVCSNNASQVTIITDAPVTKPNAGGFSSKCELDPTPVVLGSNPQAGVTYSWSPSANLSNPNSVPTLFTGVTPGRYEFTLTGTNNSCSNSDNAVVVLNETPAKPIVTAASSICANTTTRATVTNADEETTYEWYESGDFITSGASVLLPPGTYTVRPVSNFSCVGLVSDPLVIGSIAIPPAPIVLSAIGGINGCGIEWEIENPDNAFVYRFLFGNDPRGQRIRTGPGPHVVNYLSAGDKLAIANLTTPDGCNVSSVSIAPAICAVLPVNLQSFTGTWLAEGASLQWNATSIQQFSHFEIERSYNGQVFEKAGTVKVANGVANGQFNYTDHAISKAAGMVYYQLKMVDKNGRFEYSNVVQLRRNIRNAYAVMPNPFQQKLQVDVQAPMGGKATISLMSVSGRVVMTRQLVLSAGFNRFQLEGLGGIVSGQYLLRIATNNDIQHIKVQKY